MRAGNKYQACQHIKLFKCNSNLFGDYHRTRYILLIYIYTDYQKRFLSSIIWDSLQAFSQTYVLRVTAGLASNSLYFMYALFTSPTSNLAIRKINTDKIRSLMVSFAVIHSQKSMSINSSEQSVHITYYQVRIQF